MAAQTNPPGLFADTGNINDKASVWTFSTKSKDIFLIYNPRFPKRDSQFGVRCRLLEVADAGKMRDSWQIWPWLRIST